MEINENDNAINADADHHDWSYVKILIRVRGK